MFNHLSGIYAAALTPLNRGLSLAQGDMHLLLEYLADRGCHGALLFGTTGEGPSFSYSERLMYLKRAVEIRQIFPDFKLLAGTGTPSLAESIDLAKSAFALGFDGVVVLPPYYYRSATEEGLFRWFENLIANAVPPGRALFGYHIPAISGVGLSIELLKRLKGIYPDRFAGIKDSSGDPDLAIKLGVEFGKDLVILTGNDRLLSHSLENAGSGCITALANMNSPDLRQIWDAHQEGMRDQNTQSRVNNARSILDRYMPAPPVLKAMLNRIHGFPRWSVKPPLVELSPELEDQAEADFRSVN